MRLILNQKKNSAIPLSLRKQSITIQKNIQGYLDLIREPVTGTTVNTDDIIEITFAYSKCYCYNLIALLNKQIPSFPLINPYSTNSFILQHQI